MYKAKLFMKDAAVVANAQAFVAQHASPNQRKIYSTPMDPGWDRMSRLAKFKGQVGNGEARIVPLELQADQHRRFGRAMMVVDGVLPAPLFSDLQRLTRAMALITKGWSRPSTVRTEAGQYITTPRLDQFSDSDMGHELTRELNAVLDAVIPALLKQLLPLTAPPEAIVHCNAWINTGPIGSPAPPSKDDYHFWHYDSDEYLEFWHPEPLLRFPIWGAILYIHQPEGQVHHTGFDPEGLNQRVRAVPNRLVIFDPSMVHGVNGPPTAEEVNLRSVLVLNAWDYPAIDHGTLMALGKPL